MSKPKLYIGCSLSGAPDDFVQAVEVFKRSLQSDEYDVLEFVGKIGGTNTQVYEWDIDKCVRRCDAMVAICDLPSTGLGWELATAVSTRVPILAVAHQQSIVSRLILGAAEVEPTMTFQRYEQLKDVIPAIKQMMNEVS